MSGASGGTAAIQPLRKASALFARENATVAWRLG
jgi:hypothetical protein